ncbi:MAG: YajG family lipoprotein [Planctomycetota bacterium]
MTWKAWHGPRLLVQSCCLAALAVCLTGCSTTMEFPLISSNVSYQESPIQLTSGQVVPLVVVEQVRDSRATREAGAVAVSKFEAGESFSDFIRVKLQNELGAAGASLSPSLSDAQSKSQAIRRVAVTIRQANYGGASMLYRTVAATNLLVEVFDETGQRIFAQTYFGSIEKRPVMPTAKKSGELMSQAVDQALSKAIQDRELRSVLGY